jgi:hypothetical protein
MNEIEANNMSKTFSRLVLGLGLVAAPWMMVGCSGEGEKPAAAPAATTEAAPAPGPAPAESTPAPAPATTPPAEAPK